MIGFEVRFRDQVINAAVPDGSNSIVVGKRDNGFYLDIGGMEKEKQTLHRWCYAEDLKLGEEIVVWVDDIQQITEPMDQEEYMSFFNPSEQQKAENIKIASQERLEYFYALEKHF